MSTTLSLPKKKSELAEAMKRMVKAGEQYMHVRAVQWWITHFFLEGCRNFTTLDFVNGTVRVANPNSRGIDFKVEEALKRYQIEVGRLMKIDPSPQVTRRGNTLDSLRMAAVGQATLSSIVSPSDINRTKLEAFPMLAKYGMVGILVYTPSAVKDESVAMPSIETVPPWELVSVPANPASSSEVRGVIRTRWVSLKWLKTHKNYASKLSGASEGELEARKVEVGAQPMGTTDAPHTPDRGPLTESIYPESSAKADALIPYVKMNELWVFGERGRLAQFVVTVGKVTLVDEDYTEPGSPSPMIPIGVMRYVDTGTFYSRGFVEQIIPLNIQAESFLKSLYSNMSNQILFGMLAVPTSLGLSVTELYEGADAPKVVLFERDALNTTDKVELLQPHNIGLLPAKIVELTTMLIDRMSPSGPMTVGQAPGRVDSSSGLGVIREEAATPLVLPAASVSEAYSTVYRAILAYVRESWSNLTLGAVATLDDSIAGVVIDPKTGVLDREKNAAPDPTKVDVDVVSKLPKSEMQARDDLAFAVKFGLLPNPKWIKIEARKRGIDLPMGSDAPYQAYRKAMLNNILAFGDGNTPGEVVITPYDDHELALEIIDAFMKRPEFAMADTKVRAKFEEIRKVHEQMLGRGYPDQLPYPEDMMGGPQGASPVPQGG